MITYQHIIDKTLITILLQVQKGVVWTEGDFRGGGVINVETYFEQKEFKETLKDHSQISLVTIYYLGFLLIWSI